MLGFEGSSVLQFRVEGRKGFSGFRLWGFRVFKKSNSLNLVVLVQRRPWDLVGQHPKPLNP